MSDQAERVRTLEEALRDACKIIEKLSTRDPIDTTCVACDRDMRAFDHKSRCPGLMRPGGKLDKLRAIAGTEAS